MKRLVFFTAFTILLGVAVTAQSPDRDLILLEPAAGEIIDAPQSWTFAANTGQPVSLVVRTLSGDLDPVLTIRDSSGTELIRNDDVRYPDQRDAVLEAISIPEFGRYTATVSAFGDSSGEYALNLLPGYAARSREDDFAAITSWTAWNDSATLGSANERLTLAPTGSAPGIAFDSAAEPLGDFFAQVQVLEVSGRNWAVGLTARQNAEQAYLFLVNEQGSWRFSRLDTDGETVLRDWERHPGIRQGETRFTLGMMTMGAGIDLFVNQVNVGQVVDATLAEPGQSGIAVSGAETVAQVDDFVVTEPLDIDGAPLIPQEIILGDATTMVRDLKRYRLIDADGELTLMIDESFTDYGFPGVSEFPLAQDYTFTNMALAATVFTDSVTGGPAGCGLYFRSSEPAHYTLAYLNIDGEYGVSQRDGDRFSPGIYGTNLAWRGEAARHLLIIADESTLHFYIEGQYVGSMENTPTAGGIGNAVVNFDALSTTCRYNNLWLWRWD